MPRSKLMIMRLFTILMIISLFTGLIRGQEDSTDILEGIAVRNIGPAGMSGRVTAIDVITSDPSHIYIGSASGGVWESRNGGVSWKPIFDSQPSLAIGALKVDQNNPDIIWVGTGEGNPRNSHNSGRGVFKSIDGGRSWSDMGLKDTRLIHRILIDPNDSKTVYVGAMGSAWGDSEERGVFKTTDGGDTWEKILYVDPSTGVGEMVMDPSNPGKLLVAMWEFRRTPWDFTSGGEGSGLYLTYDGGENWKRLTSEDGLPKGDLGRIGLAFAPSQPERVYALIEAKKNGLYRSNDGGHSWSLVSSKNIGNRPFYYAEIYVDPQNHNRIFNLWSYVSMSEDGGRTFETIMDYGNSIHPDHHAFYIHPENPDFIIDGNDGGLNISYDGGKTWTFLGNLPIGQFYHINYDTAYPYNIYGGMQDNGSWVGPHKVLRRGGIRNDDWQEIYFGDGFDVVPLLHEPRFGYAMSQGGNVVKYDQLTGRSKYIKPQAPDSIELRFNWNAAIARDPFQNCGVYFGSQFVHYSDDCGQSWSIISPDLTTNDMSKQKQSESGGLTLDVTKAENHTTLLCIAPSPHDEGVIWTGSDDGRLHITRNAGESWMDISDNLPQYRKGSWIPQIELGTQPGEAFVVVNDYRRNVWSPWLYHTEDYGKTFRRIVDEKDVDGFVCSVVQDAVEPKLLFLGTDAGLYYSVDKGTEWLKWSQNFPNVQVRDLKIHPVTNDLIIGTFGRSIWVIDDISFLRQMAGDDEESGNMNFSLLASADGYLSYTASYQGVRFYAQGQFIGENERRGVATFTYRFDENDAEMDEIENEESSDTGDEKSGAKSGKEKEKVAVVIFNEAGDTVRNFSFKAKTGLNRFYWGLESNGVSYPSRRDRKEDADPPRGDRVLPGQYLVVVKLGEVTDSARIAVTPDPRIEFDLNDALAKKEFYGQFETMVSRAAESMDRLKIAEKDLINISNSWKYLPDSVKKDLKKIKMRTSEKLDSLMELYVGPEDAKGYIDRSKTLRSQLGTLRALISGMEGSPGDNVFTAYTNVKTRVNELIDLTNRFYREDWQAFRSAVEEADPSMFKSFEPIENIE